MATKKKAPKRVTRYSSADIAALRFIQKNSRTKVNPNGFTNGEKLLLNLMVKLARKKGHTYATNAKLGEMLGKTASSVQTTLNRLRRRGFVIQYQLGSQHGLAYRELVLTPEKRQRMVDVYGEPSETNNFWWFILPEGEEIPNYDEVFSKGSAANRSMDCVGSDFILTNEELPSSSRDREGSENASSFPDHFEPGPGASSSAGKVGFAAGEVPPRANSVLDLTNPDLIPDRVGRDQWLAHLMGTPELQVFLNLYGQEATVEDDSFLRSLGRSIRRGRFANCPDLFNYIRQLTSAPLWYGKFVTPRELLRFLDHLAKDYVLENGFCRYETLVTRESEMKKDAEILLDEYDKFESEWATTALNPLVWNKFEAPRAPLVYDRSTRKFWLQDSEKHMPEWWFLMLCVHKRPDLLHHWQENADLRTRLVASLIPHACVAPVLDLLLGGKLSSYTGHATEVFAPIHATVLDQIIKSKNNLYASNNLSVYFQREQSNQHRNVA